MTPERVVLVWGRRYALTVVGLGLACCAVELVAALPALAAAAPPGPLDGGAAQVLVVSGTVTDKLAPLVLDLWESLPEPRHAISFGSCATCGGPYWDSYCVTKGVEQLLPVDVHVPGCPPRPEALLDGLRLLEERLAAR